MTTERDAPLLGLATTRDLLTEIAERLEVTQNSLKGRDLGRLAREAIANLHVGVLDYRTVGPWPAQQAEKPTPNTPLVEAARALLAWAVGADARIDSEWGGGEYVEPAEITAMRAALGVPEYAEGASS